MSNRSSTPCRAGNALRWFSGFALALIPGFATAEYGLNLQPPVSPVAHEIFGLHNMILIICLIIFVVVFSFMFYAIIMHRKSRGVKPAKFHDNSTIEIVWSVVPFLILVGMAIPSTATLLYMDDTSEADLTVKITGYQWKWQYEYPDHGISYFSNLSTPRDQIQNKVEKGEHYLLEVDEPMKVPVGKKVRFLITANDVIHAWWVPALGVKKDAIPGFINEVWTRVDEPGVYRGQCAEICGKDHGFMPIVVEAVEENEFNKWVSTQRDKILTAQASAGRQWSKGELMARGKQVYTQCVACHGANGEGVGPFPKMAGGKIVTGPIADHLDIVMNGKPGTAMQAFAGQLNDTDIAAVVTYERNAFGNSTGDVVQPSQVTALRK
jgi:cytochrome c oxidase subunit 2